MRNKITPEEAYYVLLDSLAERAARKAPKPRWRLAYAAPPEPGSVLGFTHARQELESAQRDLIQLASVDPRAAARHVRRIQCDRRRIWLPQVLSRLHPVRPRLHFSHDEGEDE